MRETAPESTIQPKIRHQIQHSLDRFFFAAICRKKIHIMLIEDDIHFIPAPTPKSQYHKYCLAHVYCVWPCGHTAILISAIPRLAEVNKFHRKVFLLYPNMNV